MNYPAFLAAIRDEPDSDVPRLVCADWLEDNGESDRAEFIRLQIELTRGVKDRERALALLRPLRALIVKHRARWLGVLTRHAPAAVFERGFVEHVELRAATLLDHGRAIFDEHPIHRLALRGVDDHASDVGNCPQLACLTVLDLRETDGNAVAALGASPHLGRLRALDVRNVALDVAGLRRLLAGQLPSLERLNLAGNRVGTGGATALARTANLPALRELDLAVANLDNAAAAALADAAHLAGLRSLRLSYNSLTEVGVRAVLESRHLTNLVQVEALGNEMSTDARTRLRDQYRERVQC